MRRELRDSVVAMMKYLQTNLPWDEKLYTQLSFMDPVNRTARETPIHGVQVVIRLSRFTAFYTRPAPEGVRVESLIHSGCLFLCLFERFGDKIVPSK